MAHPHDSHAASMPWRLRITPYSFVGTPRTSGGPSAGPSGGLRQDAWPGDPSPSSERHDPRFAITTSTPAQELIRKRKRSEVKVIHILNPIGPMMIVARAFLECKGLYEENLLRWQAGVPDGYELDDNYSGTCTCHYRFERFQDAVRVPPAAWEGNTGLIGRDGLVSVVIPKTHHKVCRKVREIPADLVRDHIWPRSLRHLTHDVQEQQYRQKRHEQQQYEQQHDTMMDLDELDDEIPIDPVERAARISKSIAAFVAGSRVDFTSHDATPEEFRGLFKIAGIPERVLDDLIEKLTIASKKAGRDIYSKDILDMDDIAAEHKLLIQKRDDEANAHYESRQRTLYEIDEGSSEFGDRDKTPTQRETSHMQNLRDWSIPYRPNEEEYHRSRHVGRRRTAVERRVQMDGCDEYENDRPALAPVDSTLSNSDTTGAPSADSASKAAKIDRKALKARYEARLTSFLAARHADGPDGRPAKNRQELLDGRRLKEERLKARKKELRAKARADAAAESKANGANIIAANKSTAAEESEDDDDDTNANEVEAEASRLRGGQTLSLAPVAPLSRATENFTFGQLTGIADDATPTGRKSHDLKAALTQAEKQARRLSSFDPAKRAHIQDREAWKGAAARVGGERVRDDAGLLKKSLKKREKEKERSRKAWEEREKGVEAGMAMKQKKRTENLQKRRPGFEGTFRIGGGKKRQ